MTALDATQRASLIDRLIRRIGKLDDDNLLRLEALTRGAETGQPLPPTSSVMQVPAVPGPSQIAKRRPQGIDPERQSRRYFLVTLVAGSVLAASAGGAAAIALNDDQVRRFMRDTGWMPSTTPLPPTQTTTPTLTPTLPVELLNQIDSLQKQVAALTTERNGLNTQLGATNTRLSALQTAHTNLQGLLALYNQLDSIDLDQIVTAALVGLGVPVVAIDTIRETLDSGIVLTVRILQGIEDQMPLIAAGLDWLDQQVTALSSSLRTLEQALQVSANSDVTQAEANFISSVLDLLPFGAGQDIKTALQAMGNVIGHLPDLLDNVSARVLEPARAWIVTGKAGGLYDLLLTPLRNQLLAPAQQIVANAQNLNKVYNTSLAQPAQSALDQRAKIRAEIKQKAVALSG